jgi:hypothetical protein
VNIVLGPDLSRVVDEAIAALGGQAVFQRQGALVDIVREAATKPDGITRPDGVPRIRMVPNARLREALTIAIDFKRRVASEDGGHTLRSVSPPLDVVQAVAARGEWGFIRPLAGIAEWPVLRANGSVLQTAGYDRGTTLIYEPNVEVAVPESPGLADAQAAVEELYSLVADFPFEKPAHRSAWLAAFLTLLARPAIDGPTPLTLIDANERGTGKTLLADVIGVILRGKPLPRRTAPEESTEWKKALLAIAIAADPIILLDNVTRMLKSDAFDAVLTGTAFRERVLGRNEELTLDIRTVFLATANNATLSADLVRRSLHVRIESHRERPEQRSDFRFPNLLEHVREHRAQYLAAGLTLLRAYIVAGRPAVTLRKMGSYEAWSAVVRAPLVWAGQPDPAETQDALRESADPEHEGLGALLHAWRAIYGDKARTARQVLGDLGDSDDHLDPKQHALHDSIAVLCDADAGRLPTLRKFGNRLRVRRGKIVRGLLLERAGDSEDGATWRVRPIRPDSADSAESVSPPSRKGWEKREEWESESADPAESGTRFAGLA